MVLGIRAAQDTLVRISGELGDDAPRYREIRVAKLDPSRRPDMGLFYRYQSLYDWFARSPVKSIQCDLDLLHSLGLEFISLDHKTLAWINDEPVKTRLQAFDPTLSTYSPMDIDRLAQLDAPDLPLWWTATGGPLDLGHYTPVSDIEFIRQYQPNLKLAGFINHRDDLELAQSLDLSFIGEGFGLSAARVGALDPNRTAFFNLAQIRLRSGLFAANHGVSRSIYWHARDAKGLPTNPIDGQDYQWIQADSTCDQPVIDARLLTLVEAISDWRVADTVGAANVDFDAAFSGAIRTNDRTIYRWRQSALIGLIGRQRLQTR